MLATPETLGRTQDREWRVLVRRPPSQNRSTGRRHLCQTQLQYNNRATRRPSDAKLEQCSEGIFFKTLFKLQPGSESFRPQLRIFLTHRHLRGGCWPSSSGNPTDSLRIALLFILNLKLQMRFNV